MNILIGGSGDDDLQGGAGFDSYRFSAGAGYDAITDSDGNGEIVYFGRTLGGADSVVSGVWQDEVDGITFTFTTSGTDDLLITNNLNANTQLILGFKTGTEFWDNDHLGISLQGPDDPPPDPPDNGDGIGPWNPPFRQAEETRFSDPLVLDLDGDGVELLSFEDGIAFDITGDGRVESIGWAAPDDGLLVLDRNGNGQIDDITELFGSDDINGFTELADEEADNGVNTNRIINAVDDPLFQDLQFWRDANSDGLVQGGELATLADHDITELDITLNAILPDNRWVQGNQIIEVSHYTRGDGTTGEIGEVLFRIGSEPIAETGTPVYEGNDPDLLALPQAFIASENLSAMRV